MKKNLIIVGGVLLVIVAAALIIHFVLQVFKPSGVSNEKQIFAIEQDKCLKKDDGVEYKEIKKNRAKKT